MACFSTMLSLIYMLVRCIIITSRFGQSLLRQQTVIIISITNSTFNRHRLPFYQRVVDSRCPRRRQLVRLHLISAAAIVSLISSFPFLLSAEFLCAHGCSRAYISPSRQSDNESQRIRFILSAVRTCTCAAIVPVCDFFFCYDEKKKNLILTVCVWNERRTEQQRSDSEGNRDQRAMFFWRV